jgi:hypothetical protein
MRISRRGLLRCWAAPIGAALVQRVAAVPISVDLANEFSASTVKAISPDGARLCIEDWMEHGVPMRVLEIGTWRGVYSGTFSPRALSAQFFGDNHTLLVQSVGSRVIVDTATGMRTQRTYVYDRQQRDDYYAAGERTLLVFNRDPRTGEGQTVRLLELPDYREVIRVPYATQPRKPHPVKGSVTLSTDGWVIQADNRKVLLYSFDDVLVCRRTEDLAILWTKSVEPGLEFIKVAISADGTRIAASVGDPRIEDLTRGWRQRYLGVYDGRTGDEIMRLQVDGSDWITLSADGRLIAVVSHERGEKGAVVPAAAIYEIPSGRKVALVVHGPVKRGRRQWLEAGITVAFTSDGKYLITSGMATRVWSLGDMAGQHA